MNNQELIRTLDRDDLLSVIELLSQALIFEDFDLLEDTAIALSDEVWEYCKSMSGYEQLKLMQLIINMLIHEAEQSAVQHLQMSSPLSKPNGKTTT